MVSKKIIHKLQLETIKNNKNGAQTNLLIAPPKKNKIGNMNGGICPKCNEGDKLFTY